MNQEQVKPLLFALGTLALGGAALWAGPKLLGAAAGPEADVVSQLKRTERYGMTLAVGSTQTPLKSAHHHFDRITVQVGGEGADAVSTLDFTGTLGPTLVSSLGVEHTPFSEKAGWAPSEGWAPRLCAIVSALEARRAALEKADREALTRLLNAPGPPEPALEPVFALKDRRYEAKAWYIRAERDSATVSEDYRLTGSLPDRPVDEEGTRRLALERRGSQFFFSQGLM